MNRRTFLTSAVAGLALAAQGADANSKLRVAVIGHTGRGNYGHGLDTMWLQLPETEIVAVADADAKGLEGAKAKLKVNNGFADYRKMLAEVKPDIAAIGPRHIDQHRDMVLAAVGSGARGIYIEKPFCRTPAEADELVSACERRKVRLAVAHRNRYHPVVPVIQKLIADDAIGRVLEIRTRGKEDQRGGPLDLWVLGSHLLNLVTAFAGRPLACSATVSQDGRPVTRADVKEGDEGVGPLAGNEVHARFEMERGIPVFFESVQKAGIASAGFGIQIIGAKGIIDVRADKEPAAHLLAGSPFQPGKEPRAWVQITTAGVGKPEPIANLDKQMSAHLIPGRDLIAAIREGREPLCNVRDGATTVEMICAVFESHRLGGARVTLPLKTRQNPFTLL
ncbi:MAG: Gfo/Idh/MocA family oxidoreductase [Verrucomicrobiota bacterium]